MKKLILFLLCAPCFVHAQNVGIGNPIPAEKLDVSGNVNITGTIKANGVAGTNGQLLMSTGSGLSWGSTLGYKKCTVFLSPVTSTWNVPAGVTEIMVEAWGGGSGGTANCGGTSGGYARCVQTVTPGASIGYTVGSGGNLGVSISTPGGNSSVTFPGGGTLTAFGGGAVNGTSPGTNFSGSGTFIDNAFFMNGSTGHPNYFSYGQKTATVFVEFRQYGSGGAAPGLFNPTVQAGDAFTIENGSAVYQMNGTAARVPGNGGPAGVGSGWNGATGMVIIWFNN